MPPISNEIDRAYYFAFICLFVKLFCAIHILRTLHARVLKFYIWVHNEKIADQYFFFLVQHVCLELCSFEKKSELNLVSKISRKVFKLGS